MPQKIKLWPQKNLVLISRSGNLHMFLKEVVRSVGWHLLKVTSSVREAMSCIEMRQAAVIVIDDSAEAPAVSVIRELMGYFSYFTIPIFSFVLDQHQAESGVLNSLSPLGIVGKPLTPSRFLPSFGGLIRCWETKEFMALRMCFYRYSEQKNPLQFQEWLKKLMLLETVGSAAGMTLAGVYLHAGRIKDAEKVLLHLVKSDPRNLSILLCLGDLYLKATLPGVALKFYQSVRDKHPHSCSLLPDLIQARMMLGQTEHALRYLEEMMTKEYMLECVNPMVAKFYLSQGRAEEALQVMRERKGLFNKMKKSWDDLSGSD